MPKYFAPPPPSSLTNSELKLDKYRLKCHTCIILKSIFLHFSPLRLPKVVHFFQTLARCDHFRYYGTCIYESYISDRYVRKESFMLEVLYNIEYTHLYSFHFTYHGNLEYI